MVSVSKKSKQLIVAAGLALGVFALGACSGGGGSISSPVAQPNQPSMPSGQWSGSLAQAGMSVNLPSVVGFHETMTFPANNAASGTTLTIKLSSAVPAGMPALDPDMHVALPFFYFTLSSSKTVTLNGFPGFTLKAPAHFDYGNLPAKIGYYDPATGWKHIGNMTYTSGVLTFTPTSTHTTMQANVVYYALPYTCGGPSPSPTPTGVISCTASGTGAIGVLCTSNHTYAFVGNGPKFAATVEQVDISGGATGGGAGHVTHTYTSGQAAAYTECSSDEKHLRVLCGAFSSAELMDITASGGGGSDVEFNSGATGSVAFSGGTCTICAIAYDPVDNGFIVVDPNTGGTGTSFCTVGTPGEPVNYQRFREGVHTSDMTIADPDGNENPGYDYVSNRVFSPAYCGFRNSGGATQTLEIADFNTGKLYTSDTTFSSVFLPDSGNVDVVTHVGVAPNESGNVFTTWDVGTAAFHTTTLTVSGSTQTLATATTGCGDDNDENATDSVLHLTFITGEFCSGGFETLGFLLLPTTSSGLSISDWAYAKVPNTPDGNPWDASHDPHPIAAFNDPVNCPDCAIFENLEGTWIGVVDLNKLKAAPRSASDTHSIDPAYDLKANHVIAFYAI
jgi:hypothetical protein